MQPGTQQHPEKIRLAFLVRSLDYGGAQRQLVTLAKALDKSRFEISVLTFYAGQALEQELDGAGVRVISLEKSGRWDLFPFLLRLLQHTKRLRPDIIHGYLDIPNLLALLLKPFVRARVVWGVRASRMELRDYNWLLRLAARLERSLARFPDLIIVNSVAAREHHIAQGFPEHRLVMIPNGVDTEVFKPNMEARAKLRGEWGVAENTCLIGTVGRIDPVKDLPSLLRAAAIVSPQRPDARFICVGTGAAGYAQQLRTLTADLGLTDRVIWVEARSDIPAVYNSLDLIVSSSRSESFPNAIAEAMACGVPCVVTNVGDSARLVGDCGIVVPPENPAWLATGILAAIRTEAGNNGRSRIIEHFGVGRLTSLTEKTLVLLVR
jgi:glycosyltransferase involved in cell wall biosynthesis